MAQPVVIAILAVTLIGVFVPDGTAPADATPEATPTPPTEAPAPPPVNDYDRPTPEIAPPFGDEPMTGMPEPEPDGPGGECALGYGRSTTSRGQCQPGPAPGSTTRSARSAQRVSGQ